MEWSAGPSMPVPRPTRMDLFFVPIAALLALPAALTLAGGRLLFLRYIDGGTWRSVIIAVAFFGLVGALAALPLASVLPVLEGLQQ